MIDAQEMFELRGKAGQIEDAIYERLCEIFGEGIIEDTSYDWYDESIELYSNADLVPTAPQVDEMLSWGFGRGWINFKDETQIYFTKDRVTERHKRSYEKYPRNPRRMLPPPEELRAEPTDAAIISAYNEEYVRAHTTIDDVVKATVRRFLPFSSAQLAEIRFDSDCVVNGVNIKAGTVCTIPMAAGSKVPGLFAPSPPLAITPTKD